MNPELDWQHCSHPGGRTGEQRREVFSLVLAGEDVCVCVCVTVVVVSVSRLNHLRDEKLNIVRETLVKQMDSRKGAV